VVHALWGLDLGTQNNWHWVSDGRLTLVSSLRTVIKRKVYVLIWKLKLHNAAEKRQRYRASFCRSNMDGSEGPRAGHPRFCP
jgi:hypothetical protein